MICFEPIGVVHSPETDIARSDWSAVVAEIHLDPAFVPALQGISEWSHLDVLFHLNRAAFDPTANLHQYPRDRTDLPLMGVFAIRTQYRPNAIAVSTVELLQVRDNVLTVRGLDAIDGTPVLDIKPYTPRVHPDAVRRPAWLDRLEP